MPFELVTSQDRLGEVANAVDRAEAVGFDIETTSLRPWDGDIRLFSVKTPQQHFVVDLFKTGHPEAVVRALTDPKTKTVKVIQNAKFEQRWFLHKYGVEGELWPIFDPFRASNLIHNGRDLSHDLFSLQARELKVKPGEDLAASNWGGELSERQLQYSADDTEYLLPLRDSLKAGLSKYGLNRVALIEFGAVLPESAIENNGFYLDRERWLALYEQNKLVAKRLRQELSQELPHPRGQLALPGIEDGGGFNIGSTQQLQQSLARLGVEVTSTNKDVLGLLIPKIRKKAVRDILVKLIEYKKVKKLCESFGPDFLNNIDPKTGRIHTSFYPYTGAGRYSSSNPNLQQIPRLKAFRDCFMAVAGMVLGIWDYSQIELRIAADISGDARMIRAYNEGLDLHILTAALLNDIGIEEVTKAMRQPAKAGNFGLLYGMGAPKLAAYAQTNYGVAMDEDEAGQFRTKFFQGYSGLQRWHRQVFSDHNKKKGYTRTLSGRLRYLEPITHSEWANTPVQGTGADGLKAALRLTYMKLKPYGSKVRMVNMVHDEIVAEASGEDPGLSEQVDLDVKRCMVEGMQQFLPTVPVVVEGGWGSSWADKG